MKQSSLWRKQEAGEDMQLEGGKKEEQERSHIFLEISDAWICCYSSMQSYILFSLSNCHCASFPLTFFSCSNGIYFHQSY